MKETNKPRIEIERIGRLEIKRIIKEFHELANDPNMNLRIEF